ncbi:hypothetical protein QOL99_09430 [Deinococcus sp. MIMF12]|uniref:Uncharacterized protein n=1 Tax=Deinococcus rhizophilus TaxID=3049544 RepID=A0ABT7JL45_9DEIO|nr:hypothetical protein [Deinococcus rhizophilus]MDL2344374.1 hypothetical protein [Deinococcus rhizophilus]
MTRPPAEPSPLLPPTAEGEIVISGVDTGPADAERGNLTPTEDHARFQPPEEREPEDEDG